MNIIYRILITSCTIIIYNLSVSEVQNTVFTLQTSTQYGATRLGHEWISTDVFSCIVTCQTIYPACYSVAFSNETGRCTPGSIIQYGVSPLSSYEQDDFYFADYCKDTYGFQLVLYNTSIECLFISTEKMHYFDAKNRCAAKNGRLFTAILQDRFQLFGHVVMTRTMSNTWIGLSNNNSEQVWIWENGEPLDTSIIPSLFIKGQPDNKEGHQHCIMGTFEVPAILLDDVNCRSSNYYICETLFS